MPAIVRQTLSRKLARDLLLDIANPDNEYYIGISKSDTFNEQDTVVPPVDCPFDEREFRHGLQSIKKIEGSTFVAKRVNWSSGSEYAGWDDTTASDIVEPWTPWYVMNDAKEVYVCLETGLNIDGTTKQSIIEPNWGVHAPMSPETDPNAPMFNVREWWKPFETADGYIWKYSYSLRPENIYQYLSSNHIPVQKAEPDFPTGDSIEDLQTKVRDEAIGGQILRATILDAGFGHTNIPTINIHGDGNGAVAVAEIDANTGAITKIKMTSYGSGYTHASFEIIGGATTSTARAVITSEAGLGFDPIDDLKTSSVMTNIKPDGDVGGTFITFNTFRQMGLIKNPLQVDGTPFTGASVKTLPSITLVNNSPFESGKVVTGSISGATAYVNQSIDKEVFYHQNESTGFKPFQVGEALVQSGIVLTGDIESISLVNGIDRFSGNVMYIESRHRIRRDPEQQEDIKIVITV